MQMTETGEFCRSVGGGVYSGKYDPSLIGREFVHFKGGRYRLLGFAKTSEGEETVVVYSDSLWRARHVGASGEDVLRECNVRWHHDATLPSTLNVGILRDGDFTLPGGGIALTSGGNFKDTAIVCDSDSVRRVASDASGNLCAYGPVGFMLILK